MKKKIFFENLDTLRFLCFLSVFFFHSFHTDLKDVKGHWLLHFLKKEFFVNGNIGVNFFFVLSGFLITYLLIVEKRLNNKIDVKSFWLRRILRIWPLFYACVAFGFFVFPQIKSFLGQPSVETAHISYYLTFLNNFDFIKSGLPDSSILGVLWSVAIEEQFYLVWPVILAILPIKNYWIAFATIILSSWIFRFYNPSGIMLEHHTLSCIGDMAIGATGAWLYSEKEGFKNFILNLKKPIIALIYVLFFGLFFFRKDLMFSNPIILVFERSILAILILFIILEQNFTTHSIFKLGKLKLFSELGKITYGLYSLHFLGILVTLTISSKLGLNKNVWEVVFIEMPISLVITVLISKISFKYFEMPFLKFKDKFSYITQK